MSTRRSLLTLVMVLHTVHAPLLVPDLDGECRGTPIHCLAEAQAWHPVLLGVRPNDDVDRGPIRTDRSGTSFDGSQFGDLAIVQGKSTVAHPMTTSLALLFQTHLIHHPMLVTRIPADLPIRLTGETRTIAIRLCRWQV